MESEPTTVETTFAKELLKNVAISSATTVGMTVGFLGVLAVWGVIARRKETREANRAQENK